MTTALSIPVAPALIERSRVLEVVTLFSRPVQEVFEFFADAHNLDAITPPWLQFRILTPRPIAMREGALIDYRISLRGIPMRWRTRIAAYEPGIRFVDVQIKGPYSLWHHEHLFHAEGDGTRMIDRVTYAVPLSGTFIGRGIERWFVTPDVKRIFEYRTTELMKKFG